MISNFALSDDQKFITSIRCHDKHVRVMTTLHLIAWLDLANFILDPKKYVKRLAENHPFTNVQLVDAYRHMC